MRTWEIRWTGDSVGYHALLHLSQGQVCTLVKSLGTPARHSQLGAYQQQTLKLFRYLRVDNEDLSAKEILRNYGYVDLLKLENVVDPLNDDKEMLIIQPSLYYSLSRMSGDFKFRQ